MAKRPGGNRIRAAFADARQDIGQRQAAEDPAPLEPRDGYAAGHWPGAPFDKLPPQCPVIPLGVDGKTTFFIDSMGQLISFESMKEEGLMKLFRATPNYVYWAWPRFDAKAAAKGAVRINGSEVKKAIACLEKGASTRGLFDPANRVRGRGAWTDKSGRLIWHSGDALYRVDGPALVSSAPGEVDGVFYPRRASILTPWPDAIAPEQSPAREILAMLQSWTWERPKLDPMIVLGGIGTMLIGGALPWRPHVAAMGDKGVGKSEMNALIKAIMSSGLIDAANTTEAGVRQHMGLDALPVAIDEFEAAEDNRRVVAIIELARIACSGGRLLRGGQDHKGVEFIARNAFFCSGINLPPMKPQDLSRFAVLNLGKLEVGDKPPPVIQEEWGRMLLRGLMDAWPRFHSVHADWKNVLRSAGIDGRGQDTYGTLFAIAQLMLGVADMEDCGLPVTDEARLGKLIADATADERAESVDNWRLAFEQLIASPVELTRSGARVTLGGAIEDAQKNGANGFDIENADEAARLAGCKLIREADSDAPHGAVRWLLAVPPKGPMLERMFNQTRWSQGGWFRALKQAPPDLVIRDRGNKQVHKISGATMRCVLVDLKAYDDYMGAR
ncbi:MULTISPECIES: hypothetical protein [Rhodopseudomonas]|uniref:Uncharacterized protein n=1 Tax=Rhodopseudomonas palustris TaxID=1076 RepID=A0A0D7EDX9_RHOPL|nr:MULTISPECIES: hypothetical protein [Rhodopseudomonas]KIZ39049.1 hypothetical protein OO17_21565 [Rhodopseudomonas palustris]MDF3809276.1 hypothetical protein [Rhodopseudomonas sp. BAL398]WOK19040.1 hypothetical protein RBJ75_05845 [Rhodopseudomonas sp. BAL398]